MSSPSSPLLKFQKPFSHVFDHLNEVNGDSHVRHSRQAISRTGSTIHSGTNKIGNSCFRRTENVELHTPDVLSVFQSIQRPTYEFMFVKFLKKCLIKFNAAETIRFEISTKAKIAKKKGQLMILFMKTNYREYYESFRTT